VTAEKYHGIDGLGDAPELADMVGYTDWIDTSIHAAEYIVNQANKGDFNLICIGPLTNVALAMCLDPDLPSKVDNIYIMGGTLYGKGNWAPGTEYNFACDPEATAKVINAFKNMHIVPWEAWEDFHIPKEMNEQFFISEEAKLKFFGQVHTGIYLRSERILICDGFTAALAIDPSLCTESHDLVATAYYQGESAGQISYLWENYSFAFDKKNINCRVYHKFKLEETVELLLKSLRD